VSEPHTVQNRLLISLPPGVLVQIWPFLTRIPLPLRMPIYRPDSVIDTVKSRRPRPATGVTGWNNGWRGGC